MTVEEIKEKIKNAEAACVNEMLDMSGGKADVLVMDVHPRRNVQKALRELGIEKYCISCGISYDSVTYTIYV